MPNYSYTETTDQSVLPVGDGWEFWGMRITPDEQKAVWRKLAE